jgi:hypothetical protein
LAAHMIVVVIDHKQKILPSYNREGQSEYFSKKGMSLLGAMFLHRRDESNLLQVTFNDFICRSDATQDSNQVHNILQLLPSLIRKKFPLVKEIIMQSDNASCFSSGSNVSFIHHFNKQLKAINLPIFKRWIFTEAQTGKTQLDTHFSYVQKHLKSVVDSGRDILLPIDIFNAYKCFNGIAGTSAILFEVQPLSNLSIKVKPKLGISFVHDIIFNYDTVELRLFSGKVNPEVLTGDNLSCSDLSHDIQAIDVLDENFIECCKMSSLHILLEDSERPIPQSQLSNIGIKIEECLNLSIIRGEYNDSLHRFLTEDLHLLC